MASTSTAPGSTQSFLRPIEKPKGLFLKMGYAYSRREFGSVFSPLSVFCARMPSAFTRFYGKIGSLDKKLEISQDTVKLIREQVATVNGCLYCMDANKFAAIHKADGDLSELLRGPRGTFPQTRTKGGDQCSVARTTRVRSTRRAKRRSSASSPPTGSSRKGSPPLRPATPASRAGARSRCSSSTIWLSCSIACS